MLAGPCDHGASLPLPYTLRIASLEGDAKRHAPDAAEMARLIAARRCAMAEDWEGVALQLFEWAEANGASGKAGVFALRALRLLSEIQEEHGNDSGTVFSRSGHRICYGTTQLWRLWCGILIRNGKLFTYL